MTITERLIAHEAIGGAGAGRLNELVAQVSWLPSPEC